MRRANGTGFIIKLLGNRRQPYLVRTSARDKDSYVRQVALSYHVRLQEAQETLEAYNHKAITGQTPHTDMLSWTMGQVYTAWSAREYPRLGLVLVASHKAAQSKQLSRYETEKIRSITLDDWQAILDEGEDEGRFQSSINNNIPLVRAFNTYATMWDIIGKGYSAYPDTPIVGIKVRGGPFGDLQVAVLEKLTAAGYPGTDSALIMCYTDLQVFELFSPTPFSYHPEEGGYLQGGVEMDAGRARIIPVHTKIAGYLRGWIAQKGQPTAMQCRALLFRPLAEELGCPDTVSHWCRHILATRLSRVGTEELTTKRLLGHSIKDDVTQVCIHPTVADLTKELRKLV